MTKTQMIWERARRLLSDPIYFNEERERVLANFPNLNSYGLGQTRRWVTKQSDHGKPRTRELEELPSNPHEARDELRRGGTQEQGIRNTLEYLVEGKISLSYRLRGCSWARSINGHAPSRQSSYKLKQQVEPYLRERDTLRNVSNVEIDRHTSNGAFICGALMTGIRMWQYRDSVNPDFRLGEPWAVAGMQPEDYAHARDEGCARFWRWAIQHDIDEAPVESFIRIAVDLLYEGADLERLHQSVQSGRSDIQRVYERFLHEFGLDPNAAYAAVSENRNRRLGFLSGQISVPDDFDELGQKEIERLFHSK